MDSKVVNKSIREIIRPVLKEACFTKFTGRNSWRYHEDRIEVVNFQSFNSYNASVLGVTTYSFSVNLGCYFLYVPSANSVKEKGGFLQPEEYECHFRGQLQRSLIQPENSRDGIWLIDEKGAYLRDSLSDVTASLNAFGFPWFQRLSNKDEVLRILKEDDEKMGELWGFGRNPSPIRSLLTGYVAQHLGKEDVAKNHIQKAVDSGCFKTLCENVDAALERGL